MKSFFSFLLVCLFCSSAIAQYSKEDQINMALLAAPEEVRSGATVYGFDEEGKLVTLRKGTNEFIVRSDDPNRNGFEVVCYKQDIEPYMARGRELRAEGKGRGDILKIREQEAADGKIKMPETPSTLHIYSGREAKYNPETNSIEGASYRYVIYIPQATQATTGLPLKPNGPGHPWLMFPGTYGAHIMITPPREN